MNFELILLPKQPIEDFYLEVGKHTMPFQITLPENLPTSYEHDIGRIRYSIKSQIDIPW